MAEVVRLDAREAEGDAVAGEVGHQRGLGSSVEHEPSYTLQARAAGRCTAGSGSVRRR